MPSCLLGGAQDYGILMLVTATSRHPGGVNLLFADGSARFAERTIAAPLWKALGTIAGGEVADAGAY